MASQPQPQMPVALARDETGYDEFEIQRELDRVKSRVFLNNNAAFLGSIMSSMEFYWSRDVATAATNGAKFWWNPDWFMSLEPDTRKTVLVHELWHAALLHMVRMGSRDPKIWNYACVAKGTRIAMADGSSKPVQSIMPGDKILNAENGTSVVALRINSGVKPIFVIDLENGAALRCTQEHKVLTENGFQVTSQLAIGTPCFVDTRHGGVSQEELGHTAYSGDRGSAGYEISAGGIESLHRRPNAKSQTITPNDAYAEAISSGVGIFGWLGRWGGNDLDHQQDGEREAVPQAGMSCDEHMSQNAGLANHKRLWLNSSRESEGMLVLYHAYPEHSPERLSEETRAVASYQAALSNAGAALDRDPREAALQVYANARNAINSREHPGLEYVRVREIRELPAEECFDLVTSDHHYIADGVVVHNCDIRINNDLELEGYTFSGTSPWKDQSYGKQAEEDIYDALMQNALKPPPSSSWGPGPCSPNGSGGQDGDQTGGMDSDGDMIPMSKEDQITAVNNVVKAIHQAKLAGCGNIPGNIEQIVETFLAPIIPWEVELHKFFTDMLDEDYTWARPNRRFQDIYLPSRFKDEGRLEHLIYYQDVSGSISDQEIQRFNSELKYVWDTLEPQKMTVVQFDTRLTKIDEFNEGDQFTKVVVVGRGGTCLVPVREHIIQEKPTAAVIFTDLCVTPMQNLPIDVPVLWCTTSKGIGVPFGKLIRIHEKGARYVPIGPGNYD